MMNIIMEVNQHFVMYLLLIFYGFIRHTRSEPRISVSAPINPVDEGGILSIHCQVWDLQKGQDVTLIRILDGDSERLSMNEGVLHNVEDRVFVASRQLPDGSVVYFLSVIDVTRHDTGEYVCSVLTTSGSSDELPSESVLIKSTYFPSESDPICAPPESLLIPAGEELSLNCSSEAAFPAVSLNWERNGVKISQKAMEHVVGDRVYSSLVVRPTLNDQNAVFVCQVSSTSFPGRTQTCHVGPLTVESTSHLDNSVAPKVPKPTQKVQDNGNQNQNVNSNIEIWTDVPEECKTICESETPVFFWILATAVAATLAFIFFIVCLSIFLKYYSMTDSDTRSYLPGQLTAEEIYSEVEQKRENRLYMALDKRESNPNLDCHNYIATNARRL